MTQTPHGLAEDPLVAKAFDAKKHEELARAIENLSSDEAAFFLQKLERAIRKRKIQLTGYLVAMGAWLATMFLALLYFGTQSGFTGWVFVVPFGCVGAILYGFGRWAEHVARMPQGAVPPKATAKRTPSPGAALPESTTQQNP